MAGNIKSIIDKWEIIDKYIQFELSIYRRWSKDLSVLTLTTPGKEVVKLTGDPLKVDTVCF